MYPRRLSALGIRRLKQVAGKHMDRSRLRALCGSARAGDQFLYQTRTNGFVVHLGYGAYAVPRESTIDDLVIIDDPRYRRILAHQAVLADSKEGARPLYLGALAWRLGLADFPDVGPAFFLSEGSEPRFPSLFGSFAMDSLLSYTSTINIDTNGIRFDIEVPEPLDLARVMLGSLDEQMARMGRALLAKMSDDERRMLEGWRVRWGLPRRLPAASESSRLALPQGPPGSFRLFTPEWFQRAHDASAKRLLERAIRTQ